MLRNTYIDDKTIFKRKGMINTTFSAGTTSGRKGM